MAQIQACVWKVSEGVVTVAVRVSGRVGAVLAVGLHGSLGGAQA